MKKKTPNTHTFVFNNDQNGGEHIVLDTTFHETGRMLHELTLCSSYGNSATFTLFNCFTPDNLRKLANELETKQHEMQVN